MSSLPLWRSLLYVPANNDRFIDKAHLRNADGLILDFEDSVPVAELNAARNALAGSVASCRRNGADVLVRINAIWELWPEDLDAAVIAGVRAIVLPKVESVEEVKERTERISQLEKERSLPPGDIGLYVLVESPASIFRVDEIARCSDRALALGLGAEDFAQAVGMDPNPETLALPRQLSLYAARAAGILPLGLIGSITDYRDEQAMLEVAKKSAQFGFEGASCIHPNVVSILNDAFSPSPLEVAEARRIVDAYDEAMDRGVGAISIDGRMIDVPVAERARRVLTRHDVITQKYGDGS